jgi:hypothetical protein
VAARLSSGEQAGGALGYGLIAASILLLSGGALAALAALASSSGLGASPAIALVLGIPLLLLVDAIYTAIVSATMVGTIILVLLVNLAPALVARISPALAMTDSAWLVGMLVALTLISWLAVRLSCTAAAMADHMRFNPFFGIAMSWRMTAPAQWRIMAFLATVGLALCLAVAGLALIFGIGIVSRFQPGGIPPEIGTALWIAGVIAAIPLAFLTVLVPAGIYRELRPRVPEEEIFS